MSLLQKTYVDYRNLGDNGTDTTGAIQPILDGEPASATVFGRPNENMRSRTEIARDVFDDLLYYRDRCYRYLLEVQSPGLLTWGVGGVGRVQNTGDLTIRPFITTRTNLKGQLTVGTAGVNQMLYTVQAAAYATQGMNAITFEHRNVPGTVTPTVTITPGPIYRVLVVFDSTNGAHLPAAVVPIVNAAFTANAVLNTRIVASNNGNASVISAVVETPIDIRTHAAGTTGLATSDVEAHVLVSGALNTFTTTNPLTEGDLLAIRYDYLIEPGSAADDPKGGVPGGRAESNVARGNADVSANLFIAQSRPEWLPGCIPLCKVVNGNLHWVDGTVLGAATSGSPGAALGTFVNSSVFSGLPTLIINGGIDNSGTLDTVQEALVSVNERLGQHRYATFCVTDGTNSTGGVYNAANALLIAISGCTNGGKIFVRRGAYSQGFPTVAATGGCIDIEGETSEQSSSGPINATQTANATVDCNVRMRNMSFTRSGAFRATLSRDVTFQDVIWQSGTFTLGNSAGRKVDLRNCTMTQGMGTADTVGGLILNGEFIYAENCTFRGPDLASATGVPPVFQGSNVVQAAYNNCVFDSTGHAAGAFEFATTGNTRGTVFTNCSFLNGTSSRATIAIPETYTGGDITFIGCTFTNAAAPAVCHVANGSSHVKFINCKFSGAGSPNGLATTLQQMITLFPAATASAASRFTQCSFINCEAYANMTNFTNMTRCLVEFGGRDTAVGVNTMVPCAGQVIVKGFRLSFINTPTLPPTAAIFITGRQIASNSTVEHCFENLEINANGIATPATPSTVNNIQPCLLTVVNYFLAGSPAPQTISGVKLWGLVGPGTDNTAFGVIYAQNAILRNVTTRCSVGGAGTNRYASPQYDLPDSIIEDGALELMNTSSTGGGIVFLSSSSVATCRSTLRNVSVRSSVLTGATFTDYVFVLNGGRLSGVSAKNLSLHTNANAVIGILGDGFTSNIIEDCDIYVPDSVPMILAFGGSAATAATRGQIRDNKFISGLTAGAFISCGAASPTGLIITGNQMMTNGATAVNCIPDMSVITDTLTLVKSNNTFATAVAVPH